MSIDIITIIITGVIILGYVWRFYKKTQHKKISGYANLVSSIGVLGTFGGIAYSLSKFDPNNLDSSIVSLLGGMRIAFVTSVMGLLISIIMKTFQEAKFHAVEEEKLIDDAVNSIEKNLTKYKDELLEENKKNNQKLNSNIKELINVMMSIEKNLNSNDKEELKDVLLELSETNKNSNESIREMKDVLKFQNEENRKISQKVINSIESIEVSLVGDGEHSLVNHIRIMKDEIKEKLGFVANVLEEFADKMAKDNTEVLIEALNGVIRDFNNNLTEQFGENFKELNKAVEKLVQWQEQYKNYIDESTQHYENVKGSIDEINNSFENISSNSYVLVENGEKFGYVLDKNNEVQKRFEEELSSFNNLIDKTTDSTNRFEIEGIKNITEVTNNLMNLNKNSFELYQNHSDKLNENIDRTLNSYLDFKNHLKNSSEKVIGTTNEVTYEIRKAFETNQKLLNSQERIVKENSEKAYKEIHNLVGIMETQIKNIVEQSSTRINQNIQNLDKGLEEELNRSLNSLGTALARISNKMADDYSQVADKLNRLVQ